jgi:hypothetical protein
MKWNQLDLKIKLSPSQAVGMQAMLDNFLVKSSITFARQCSDVQR